MLLAEAVTAFVTEAHSRSRRNLGAGYIQARSANGIGVSSGREAVVASLCATSIRPRDLGLPPAPPSAGHAAPPAIRGALSLPDRHAPVSHHQPGGVPAPARAATRPAHRPAAPRRTLPLPPAPVIRRQGEGAHVRVDARGPPKPEYNPRGAQLIATTHDTNVLSCEHLRRDQIWFCEKDEAGASHIFSLAAFKLRSTDRFEKGYLEGRFGAIPFAGDLSALIRANEQ